MMSHRIRASRTPRLTHPQIAWAAVSTMAWAHRPSRAPVACQYVSQRAQRTASRDGLIPMSQRSPSARRSGIRGTIRPTLPERKRTTAQSQQGTGTRSHRRNNNPPPRLPLPRRRMKHGTHGTTCHRIRPAWKRRTRPPRNGTHGTTSRRIPPDRMRMRNPGRTRQRTIPPSHSRPGCPTHRSPCPPACERPWNSHSRTLSLPCSPSHQQTHPPALRRQRPRTGRRGGTRGTVSKQIRVHSPPIPPTVLERNSRKPQHPRQANRMRATRMRRKGNGTHGTATRTVIRTVQQPRQPQTRTPCQRTTRPCRMLCPWGRPSHHHGKPFPWIRRWTRIRPGIRKHAVSSSSCSPSCLSWVSARVSLSPGPARGAWSGGSRPNKRSRRRCGRRRMMRGMRGIRR